jgi:hypothetical protein
MCFCGKLQKGIERTPALVPSAAATAVINATRAIALILIPTLVVLVVGKKRPADASCGASVWGVQISLRVSAIIIIAFVIVIVAFAIRHDSTRRERRCRCWWPASRVTTLEACPPSSPKLTRISLDECNEFIAASPRAEITGVPCGTAKNNSSARH